MKRDYTVQIKDRLTTFTHIGAEIVPSFENITAVGVLPYTDDGMLVAINHRSRGYDMIGGHVEKTDLSPIDTIKREAIEEAMITLKDLCLIDVISSNYFEDRMTYILIYTARVDSMMPYEINDETDQRLILFDDAFLDNYIAGDKGIMSDALMRAKVVLNL